MPPENPANLAKKARERFTGGTFAVTGVVIDAVVGDGAVAVRRGSQ